MTNADFVHTLRATLWVIKYSIELACIPLEDLEKSQEPRHMRNTPQKGPGIVLATAWSCNRQSKPNLHDFRALVASWAIRSFESHHPHSGIVQTKRGEI